MGKPGTTLDEPVAENQRPDLQSSQHEINEYLHKQGAYDMFDFLLKDLLTKQPTDPLEHILQCLQSESYSTGPLKVIVSGTPAAGRSPYAKRLADYYGLVYISAGQLLQDAGIDVNSIGFADDQKVSDLVVERLNETTKLMQGWVLEGFPRTRVQTTYLKENAFVPNHILVLTASMEQITERHRLIADGKLEGTYVSPDALDQKLRLYACHKSDAIDTYVDRTRSIDMALGEAKVWEEMSRTVRMLPRSKGPKRPPRVVLLGPRGVGLREHASRLASRLGAVFVDGAELSRSTAPVKLGVADSSGYSVPAEAEDKLGAVGARLRQPDCASQGWVLCGFPSTKEMAQRMVEDDHLIPTRVVALKAEFDTCMMRLRMDFTDTVTGQVWTTRPQNAEVRKRLKRKPEDQSEAVKAMHSQYVMSLGGIVDVLRGEDEGRCTQLVADGPPYDVFRELAEFVERPRPHPERAFVLQT